MSKHDKCPQCGTVLYFSGTTWSSYCPMQNCTWRPDAPSIEQLSFADAIHREFLDKWDKAYGNGEHFKAASWKIKQMRGWE